jgi:Spy/CpxP family protein refolding chaperone
LGLIKVNVVKRRLSATVLLSNYLIITQKGNKMKKTIMIAFAAMFTLAAWAQQHGMPMHGRGGHPGMGKGKPGMEKMKQELNLTDAQQKQMKALQEDFRAKMKALNENEGITVKEQRDRRYKMAQDQRAAMKKILTPEQQQKMKTLREEQEKKMKERQGQHFDKVAADLKLTDAQKAQLQDIREKHMAAVKKIRENESLDRTAHQSGMKNLMEQHKKDMQKVLTKEQWEQLEKMKQDHPGKGRPGKGGGGNGGKGEGGHGYGKGEGPSI